MTQAYVTWTFVISNLDEPCPPRNLTYGTITDTSISVKWEAPIFDGNSPITNYTVSYKLEGSTTNMVNVTNITSIDLIGLTPSKTYVIVVFANNIHFSGSPNKIIVVTADSGTVLQFSFELFLPSFKDGICYLVFIFIDFRDARNEIHQNGLNSTYVLVKYFL